MTSNREHINRGQHHIMYSNAGHDIVLCFISAENVCYFDLQ